MFKRVWRTVKKDYIEFWKVENLIGVVLTLLLFGIALFTQHRADLYLDTLHGTPVSDVILNFLPTWDIDGFIIIASLVTTFIIAGLLILKPHYASFALKTLALMIIIRAFLMSLTHLGANPHQLTFDPNIWGYKLYNLLYNTNNDFFFSSHTAAPFLGALIFWREKIWRYFLLVTSFVFGVSVLIAHIHYSIDVFAAPFMAYSIFALSRELFKKDYRLSQKS